MQTPTPCPTKEHLERLVLGRLSGADAEPLVLHLETCDACQSSAQGLGTEDTLVQAIRGQARLAVPDAPLLDELIDRVSGLVTPAEETYTGILEPAESPHELGRLGRYAVLKRLGSGGMGVVFEAEELSLGRRVALKIIKPSLAAIPSVRERFLREARAVAAIDDERIVPIYQVGEERDTPYIAMQLLEGLTLEEHLRAIERDSGCRTLPVADTVRIGCEIARGLAAAHARGVIHRDVKPGNIFLKGFPQYSVKLLDFGLARGIEEELSLTQPGGFAGTPSYASPEQLAGGPIGPRCDLYGLGSTLYRLTVGRTPSALMGQLPVSPAVGEPGGTSETDVSCGVSRELSDLIHDLLARDPARRPQSALDVAERLSEIGERLVLADTATKKPALPKLPNPAGRSRLALLVTVMAIVALLAPVVIPLMTKRQVAIEKGPPASATGPLQLPVQDGGTDQLAVWQQQTAGLQAEQLVQAVAAKLQELNPGFDGKVGHRADGGRVVEFHFVTDFVTDIRPVRALRDVEILVCHGSESARGRLTDLGPVKDLPSLRYLDFSANQVQDLSPLRGLPLQELFGWANPLADLRPLRYLPLATLDLNFTFVTDLSPLEHLPLTRLLVRAPYAIDFSSLERLPLREIHCEFRPNRHAKSLRAMRTLRTINDLPAVTFWAAHDARRKAMKDWLPRASSLPADQRVAAVTAKLREFNPEFQDKVYPTIEDGDVVELQLFVDHVTDIGPVRAFKNLKRLKLLGTKPGQGRLYDLDPIRDLPLAFINFSNTQVTELSALRRMPITAVTCGSTPVNDLSPLQTLPITYLDCRSSRVTDLTPLKGLKITYLDVKDCGITNFLPLSDLPLDRLFGSFEPVRDAAVLRSIKTLNEINGQPAAEFWKTFTPPATK